MRPRSASTDLPALCTELVRQGIRTAGPATNDLYDRIVGRVERELIQQVLQSCDRVQIKAAARLGINRNTLHKKLAEYRLDNADSPLTADDRRDQNGDDLGPGESDIAAPAGGKSVSPPSDKE